MFTGRRNGGTPTIEDPPIRTSPAVGCSNPAINRSEVVLPQPDGPKSEWKAPRRTSRSTRSTATTSPYRLVTCRNSISGTAGSQLGASLWICSVLLEGIASQGRRKSVILVLSQLDWTLFYFFR